MAEGTIDGADIRLPATILGVGLGGFVDGIVLHQVLQWHHLLSSTDSDNIGVRDYPVDTVAGLEMNTLWDGIFHVVTWVAVLTGLALLYSRVTRSRGRLWRSPMLWGWALIGWGLFNLVEGVVDHHVLAIHHVRAGPDQLWWDLGFLALGVVFIVVGWLVQRRARAVDLCAADEQATTPTTDR
ncbi:Uncharacterized membrane protein [Micromonospora nigra]|uniref:Uncharacterized membrane protein n=1 Tax=Micromonospora nigra TaxID=145857 RepID=A0A1C6SW60_9ACTN|nr:DUF2243 domain-containing protein [Micromonospora nigra]SCL33781.1 Uncharacterized membrane protein [Micromonospora nigra]